MDMRQFLKFLTITLIVWMMPYSSFAKTLKRPTVDSSLEANVIPVENFQVYANEILVFVPSRDEFMSHSYNPEGKTREEKFGTMLQTKKYQIKDDLKNFRPHFGVRMSDQYLLFDGVSLNTAVFDIAEKRIWRFGDIVYDLIKPHADHGGEATKLETSGLRKTFSSRVRKKTDLKLVSGTLVPQSVSSDSSSKVFEILALTRIKGFPVVNLVCSKEDIARCRIQRRCRIPHLDAEQTAGLGLNAKLKILAVGDVKTKKVHLYRFRSCNNIVYSRSLKMPEPFKTISGVDIDDQKNLWISTTRPDDFTKGSISFWPKSGW